MKDLKKKYNVEHIEAGHTPDGYTINEVIQLDNKQNSDHRVEVYKGGAAAYYVGVNEASNDTEAYQDMGIDTDSKEFTDFEAGLKKYVNYNEKYIKDFLENAPELTVEKRQEIDKQRDISFEKETAASNEYNAAGGFLAEMQGQEKQDLSKGTDITSKEQEYAEKGETEIAKPGRTYSGNVIEVGEDTTIQQTKTGKFIIHETENLPGIKEQDTGVATKIIYDAGGKGDITAKSNDLAIAKEKEAEKTNSHDKSMER